MLKNAFIWIILMVLLVSPVMGANITYNGKDYWWTVLALNQPPTPGYHYQSFYQPSITVTPVNAYIIGFHIGGDQNVQGETSGGLLSYDGEWTITLHYADGSDTPIYLKTFHSFPFIQECDLSYDGEWWNSSEIIQYNVRMGISSDYYDNYTAVTYINFRKGNTEGTASHLMPVSFFNNPITSITIQSNISTSIQVFWIDRDQLATKISNVNALKSTTPEEFISLVTKIFGATTTILGVLWLFVDWLIIKGNLLLSILIYELACAAYYANKVPDIFIFFSKMMKANRDLINFLTTAINLTIGTVQGLLNLINPLKYL